MIYKVKTKSYFHGTASYYKEINSMSEFEQWLQSLGYLKEIIFNGYKIMENGYVDIDLFNNRKEILKG